MPRVFIGVNADSRNSISLAALLVNVTARIDNGPACPVASSHAMRVVSTRVLPLPAPARISADACGNVTAASCSGLRCSRSGEAMYAIGERRMIAEWYMGPEATFCEVARGPPRNGKRLAGA